MTQSITNISELSNVKVLSYSKELERINKIKYNLSVVYFAAVTVMMVTLFM